MQQHYPLPKQIFAISEVLAVFFIGSVIAQFLFTLAGVTGHPLVALVAENPDMIAIAIDLTKLLLLQFAGWFALLLLFTWLNEHKLKSELKLSLSGRTISQLIAIGLFAWCIGDLANKVVFLLDQTYSIGVSVPWREALLNGERNTGWWLIMFIGSFGLIPILEEVFWRGYVQSKLIRCLSPTSGILVTAGLFVFSHAQYHQLDLYHCATLIALSISALALGWVTHKTNSIIPAIVMHAMLNFPLDGNYLALIVLLMIGMSIWQWKKIKAFTNDLFLSGFFTYFNYVSVIILLVGVGAMLTLSQAPGSIMTTGIFCLIIAVFAGLIGRVRRIRGNI
jgi:membrane protease YdiL (CAAX protease family)